MRLRRRVALAGAVTLAALAGRRAAAAYPDRPIRLILPYPPGGSTDPVARILGTAASAGLGQPFVIENRSGGTGALAVRAVMGAPPDGHTLLLHTSAIALDPILRPSIGYDVRQDLTAVIPLVRSPFLIFVNANLPARTLQDFVAYAKANPRRINFGSTGVGGSSHLAGERFRMTAGLDMVHVPYRGGGPLLEAVLKDEVQVAFTTFSGAAPLLQSGALRALASTAAERSPSAPGIPTVAESGFPGYEYSFWIGIFGPARLPAPVVATLHAAFAEALRNPAVKMRLNDLDFTIDGSSAEAFRAAIAARVESETRVIREAGISLD
jgi:tripartite-type tricarboxylate transporter receptor subunit TctC